VEAIGRRVLVTGGGRGIGRAISLALAEAGADVVISYRSNPAAATQTVVDVNQLGRRGFAVQADMNDDRSIRSLVPAVVDRLGGIDVLVCNAGMHCRTPFLEIELAEWDEVLAADLRAPFVLGQAVARQMIDQGDGGRIVMTTSISADVAYPNLVHYQAAKAGLRMLVRGMALELAPHGILVNAVAPGVVETDLTLDTLSDSGHRAKRVGRIPLGRPGLPGDIAPAVVYLAGKGAVWTTGTTITVDGGQSVW
jgi:glucose 1-dehydrogenase